MNLFETPHPVEEINEKNWHKFDLFDLETDPQLPEPWVSCKHAVVPDLVNIMFPQGDAYVWFVLAPQGRCDFELVELEHLPTYGELSQQLDQEMQEQTWDDLIDKAWKMEDGPSGRSFTSTWIHWAIVHGVAPRQPFLIRFGRPVWSGPSYYDGECDVTYHHELVRVLPYSTEVIADKWEKAMRRIHFERECVIKADAIRREKQRTTVDKMLLQCRPYFARGQSTYDDMEIPRGIRFTICSNVDSWAQLVSGEDDDGNHEKAMAQLIEKALVELPVLTEEIIRKMRRHW